MSSKSVLTVVICFLNEGDEVENTVRSLRDTAGGDVDVILMNDASDDGFDYESVAKKYDCLYLVSETPQGPSVLRGRGADAAKTDKVLLLDSHMRFYKDDWHTRIAAAVDDDPRAIYCVACPSLNAKGERTAAPVATGAAVSLEGEPNKKDKRDICWHLLDPVWVENIPNEAEIVPIACVLGGAYAFDRRYFQEIGGHIGQIRYGAEEPYLSTKSWLSGGSCKAIRSVEIGHIYRDGGSIPFYSPAGYTVHNKMVYVGTTFPEDRFPLYKEKFEKVPAGREGRNYFRKSASYVMQIRQHLHANVFKHPFSFWEELNRDFRAGKDISDRLGVPV